MHGENIAKLPGIWSANREIKHKPAVSEESDVLD